MNQYEITFIVDPVLSTEDIKATAQAYVENLRKEGCEIVFVDGFRFDSDTDSAFVQST